VRRARLSRPGAEARRRGFAHERDLAFRLFKAGFAVVRAPASGSKASRLAYPDVVAIYRGRVLVFEAKAYSSLRPVYVDARRYRRLVDFAERAGGRAFLAFKLVGTGEWRLVPLQRLERVETGAYRCPVALLEGAERLDDLVRRVKEGGNLYMT